jgi:hypothetical protein
MTMYCEARTPTGLGCDSLGLNQCPKCLTMPLMLRACEIEEANKRRTTTDNTETQLMWTTTWAKRVREKAYQRGLFGPRYPVPAIHYEWSIDQRGVLLWESGVSEDQYQGKLNG